jgi:glycosyltransferase involved in cell wall biosynthesis
MSTLRSMSGGASSSESAGLVSVIIPVRNGATTIERQLGAVCDQQFGGDLEVIVVDNGSTDETAAIVQAFAAQHPEVAYLIGPPEPNRSLARNVGASHARGSLLLFCDADDVVDQGWLESLVAALQHESVVTGALIRVGSDDSSSPASRTFRTQFRGVPCLSSGNFAIRRTTFDDVGGFSPSFRHRVDIELSCRLRLAGHAVGYAADAVVRYTSRATTLQRARQHFWWAVADTHIQKLYGDQITFNYSWRNSVKHWLLLLPRALRALIRRDERAAVAITAATLIGQLVGSIRYLAWAI